MPGTQDEIEAMVAELALAIDPSRARITLIALVKVYRGPTRHGLGDDFGYSPRTGLAELVGTHQQRRNLRLTGIDV
jgi:hypothetical protein